MPVLSPEALPLPHPAAADVPATGNGVEAGYIRPAIDPHRIYIDTDRPVEGTVYSSEAVAVGDTPTMEQPALADNPDADANPHPREAHNWKKLIDLPEAPEAEASTGRHAAPGQNATAVEASSAEQPQPSRARRFLNYLGKVAASIPRYSNGREAVTAEPYEGHDHAPRHTIQRHRVGAPDVPRHAARLEVATTTESTVGQVATEQAVGAPSTDLVHVPREQLAAAAAGTTKAGDLLLAGLQAAGFASEAGFRAAAAKAYHPDDVAALRSVLSGIRRSNAQLFHRAAESGDAASGKLFQELGAALEDLKAASGLRVKQVPPEDIAARRAAEYSSSPASLLEVIRGMRRGESRRGSRRA